MTPLRIATASFHPCGSPCVQHSPPRYPHQATEPACCALNDQPALELKPAGHDHHHRSPRRCRRRGASVQRLCVSLWITQTLHGPAPRGYRKHSYHAPDGASGHHRLSLPWCNLHARKIACHIRIFPRRRSTTTNRCRIFLSLPHLSYPSNDHLCLTTTSVSDVVVLDLHPPSLPICYHVPSVTPVSLLTAYAQARAVASSRCRACLFSTHHVGRQF